MHIRRSVKMKIDLTGKRALVTGGSQGIGKVICEELAACGCEVYVNCAHNIANAANVADGITAKGGIAHVMPCDVTDENAVKRMFEELGDLDILVNNARLDPWLRKANVTEGEWFTQVMEVNLKGAFLCSWEFFHRACKRNYGRIINISSVRAYRPAEMSNIAYGASKAGMHSMARSFADNGAKYNVTANCICPGMVVTENIDKRLTPEKKAMEMAAIPAQRGAECSEVADAVLFLIGNAYITGSMINVSGGMYYEA